MLRYLVVLTGKLSKRIRHARHAGLADVAPQAKQLWIKAVVIDAVSDGFDDRGHSVGTGKELGCSSWR